MLVTRKDDFLHATAVANVGAGRAHGREEIVLESAAIELERGHGGKRRRPQLEPRGQIAVATVREEVTEPKLFELIAPEMRLEPEALLKIVGADFDARLADLERRFRNRMRPPFRHQHTQFGCLETELARQTSAGETAAENRYVEVVVAVDSRHGHTL